MRAGRMIAALAIGTTAVAVGPLARPAGAAVTTGSSGGNTVLVNATGNESITPACSGGKVAINAVVVTPQVNCSAMIQLTVAGDGGDQVVRGINLDAPEFSAGPKIVASMGGGEDSLSETSGADNLDMGPGDDEVLLYFGGAANVGLDLGAGTGDRVRYSASPLADTITAVSTGTTAAITQSNPDGGSSTTFANAENLAISAGNGNDTITSTGITAASSIDYISVNGQAGDDTITDGALESALYGGPGTNTISGGAGNDGYWSESTTDVLNGGNDAEGEYIYDTDGLRSGGRTLSGFTAADTYDVQAHQGDVVMRIRPGTAGGVRFTTSLNRPGQQVVPAPIGSLALGQYYGGALPHRGIADVVGTSKAVVVTMANGGNGLLDVTIPTGAFTANLAGTDLTVTSTYGTVNGYFVPDADHYRVHGPWTNKNQGFAHRVTRDLMFRFPTNTERDQLRDQLTNGTKTRAQVVLALTDTDQYRGLDVDRTFIKYLRRASDPSGRTYWINSIHSGKALWRFRAQLFGSNEYFTKAGGTNASYVAKAYSDVLGRTPDPSGRAYWTNKLNNGADRGSVALQFINSAEARRRLVDDQFLRFLDRYPITSEQDTWVAHLPTATGEQDLIRFLAASGAYYDRT